MDTRAQHRSLKTQLLVNTCVPMHDNYVVVYVDKDPYSIICVHKSHKIDCLIKELVIDNSFGNPTYTPDETYDHCQFVLFLLTTVLSVLLRLTASDYPFWYLQTFLQLY
jgi:hypothetical protein